MSLKQLPLHEFHQQFGATFSNFAGFEMPEAYAQSTVHEHLSTRKSAGLFDISHKSQIEVSGPDAAIFVSRLCPVNAEALDLGSVKYSFFLNTDAGIIDHLVIMRLNANRFILVVNGPREQRNLLHLQNHSDGVNVAFRVLDRALIALQGPATNAVLSDVGLSPASNLSFMRCIETKSNHIISRSGYTGENGVEISLSPSTADILMRKLVKDPRVTLSGQTARNSLRLEAGLCRYGNDITEEISPVEAGLIKAIPKQVLQTGLFVGAPALKRKIAKSGRNIRIGLTPKPHTSVSEGALIVDSTDHEVGYVSSTGQGPTVGAPIAMGYVHSNILEFGLPIFALQEGEKIPLARHRLPFVPAKRH